MVIGQGAGVAAALSAQENITVQDLSYAKLRERLLAQGQVLDLPDQLNHNAKEGEQGAALNGAPRRK